MLELLLRITVSLLVVFGLMWGLARLARRPLGGGRGGSALAVLARQQLGRSSAVAVVRVVDRALVLGVTDNQITLLGEADLAAVQAVTGAPGARRGAPVTACT
ncbi:MAG TPA: flagellar biosynthetic protein FliO, partial [Pilimelia sp.]|nr:flagellar biosynthetic protein FliO [Pilimelia sp.]